MSRITGPAAEMLVVRGQYTVVILSPSTMQRAFGPSWSQLSLFYGSNRGLTARGERAMLATSPLRPLAKGSPILVFSGDAWPDLIAPVYALETRQQAVFAIDTIKGTVTLLPPVAIRPGAPMITPEGRLVFP